MRILVVVAVLVSLGCFLGGCGAKDAHQLYMERMSNLAWNADARSMQDDIQTDILLDSRPSHLSFYAQE